LDNTKTMIHLGQLLYKVRETHTPLLIDAPLF